jgi:hypothetical protein
MTPQALSQTLEDFLIGAADAVVLEDGMVAFDLAQAKYCISGETHRCLLLLWSAKRKVVQRVVDLETRNHRCNEEAVRDESKQPLSRPISRCGSRAVRSFPGRNCISPSRPGVRPRPAYARTGFAAEFA